MHKFIEVDSDREFAYTIHYTEHKDYGKFYKWWFSKKIELETYNVDFPRHYIQFKNKEDNQYLIDNFKDNIV